MDLYSTAFSYPRQNPRRRRNSISPLPPTAHLPSSTDASSVPLPHVTNGQHTSRYYSLPVTTTTELEKEWEEVQRICLEITSREGCLVTVTREVPGIEVGYGSEIPVADPQVPLADHDRTYNFSFSGTSRAIMAARGAILREVPGPERITLKVPRNAILDSPAVTPSTLKADVLHSFETIAKETGATITINSVPSRSDNRIHVFAFVDGTSSTDLSLPSEGPTWSSGNSGLDTRATSLSSAGEAGPATNGKSVQPHRPKEGHTALLTSHGLETERLCELVVVGTRGDVESAKIRLLVMQDEWAGLTSANVEIDYKLQPIVGGRQRAAIQQIQEETATNIYMPTPLVGILEPPQPGCQQGVGYRHLVPLTMQATGFLAPQSTGFLAPQSTGYMAPPLTGQSMHMGGGHHWTPPIHQQRTGFNPMMPMHTGPMPGVDSFGHHTPHRPEGNFNYNTMPPHMNFGFHPHDHRGFPLQGQGQVNHQGMQLNGHMTSAHTGGHLSMNHTGMSTMHDGYSPGARIGPNHMPPHSQFHIHPAMHAPLQNHVTGNGRAGFLLPQHTGMSQNMPYSGPTHMHVGMSGGMLPQATGNGFRAPGVFGLDGMLDEHQLFGPHPGLQIHNGEQGDTARANQVWITGEFFGVQRARDMLLTLAAHKSKVVISRDAAILPRKLDWLLTKRLDEVLKIMSDNGTYIQVPSVGSQNSLLTVFGDHRANIERSIRSIMGLTSQFLVASLWLLPISFDVIMPQASLNSAQLQPLLKRISHATGAEVVFKNNCFEIHGMEIEVRAAIMMIIEPEVINSFQVELRIQIEVGNEHREFISGKKNGKINKIMKTAGVKIKFETFNDYNFLMDMSGNTNSTLQGLSMLHEELPAEISFHVPEIFHKRIIGSAGATIQQIMKQHGVYVKFSNAEDYAATGGYAENEDNVLARTPLKNAAQLEGLKSAIQNLVHEKDFTYEHVPIPRRYHRTLQGEKSIFVHDIERKTNASVRFPYRETASDLITIFGPEQQLRIAASMLLNHVPFEADLHVPPSQELTKLVASPEFVQFSEQLKHDHQIAISPCPNFGQADEAILTFRCQRSNIDLLGTARDLLDQWLSEHNVHMQPANVPKRVDSSVDAFSHFNSKLLATRKSAEDAEAAGLPMRPRPKSALVDVKALFEGQSAGFPIEQFSDGNTGFAGPLGLPSIGRAPDVWQMATSHAPAGPPRSDAETSKRDSDPSLQERLRLAGHTGPSMHQSGRAVSARTQSLDITSLRIARALNGSSNAFGPMPPSPGNVVTSPNTATGQYFEHGPQAPPSGQSTADRFNGVDQITQGLNNISVNYA